MSDLALSITNYVVGDDLQLDHTITELTAPIAKAWLTIKRSAMLPDDQATITKEITTTSVDGVGEIVDAGGFGVDGILRFELTQADTRTLGSLEYVFDVQLKLDNDSVYTPASGTIQLTPDVTRDTD